MNRKTLALFDIGSVLVQLDFGSFYQKAAEIAGQMPEDFKQAYLSLELASLTGRANKHEYLAELQRLITAELSEEELRELTALTWPSQIDDVVALKKKIYERGYAIGLISNIGEIGFDILSRKFPEVFETYDPSFPAIYSYKVGQLKPHPEMYRRIKGFDRVVLIDDKPDYLRTGIEQFGWYGIWFTPFIDRAEMIRSIHSDSQYSAPRFRKAESIKELEAALKHFGVNI